ncbi:GntR family transcriptional regulator [Oenococcus oeni]|uniref:Transcriptional regulator, GntR family n=11 Tax=Oenococcus oeni TaxID=1247 RepID=A0NJN7_OENOE|nr:GntR family transcriptional regulator [Oenococcus oeni]EAV39264.1 transcriptional regulator, GntR family [Oenococcus oeni ATCC BAA-1163]AWW99122.1 GntR family transcriptional regulator [Oenococcus oeni]EJO00467.1 GntR family transcriptional regulator [Oenococcus oeni AWRIB419]EJO03421.1 GntR family transcriptional regulator [Oenococcus oeni AWRIB418]EJO08376.1 GntR family transcriptional regulator [Oenococcus oeni AWRIB553]
MESYKGNKTTRKQIVSSIQMDIIKNRKIGEKLPSESEYANLFGTARSTVQKALRDLETMQLIEKVQGKGSFVIFKHPKIEMFNFKGFSEYAHQIGATPITKLIKKKKIDNGHKMLLKRLRSIKINDEIAPLTFDESILSLDDFPGLDQYNFEKGSLYDVLRNRYNTYPAIANLEVIPVAPEEEISNLLRVSKGNPLLKVNGFVYDSNSEIMEKVGIIYSDQARFKFTLGI